MITPIGKLKIYHIVFKGSPLCSHMMKMGLHKMRMVLRILQLGHHIRWHLRRLPGRGKGRGGGGEGGAGLPRSRRG